VFRDQRIGGPEERLGGGKVGTLPDVTQDRERVAAPAGKSEAFDRSSLKVREELLVRPGQRLTKRRMRARGEMGFTGGDGPLIPRADIEAVVAAEHTIAEGFAVFDGDGALVLDGEVRQALAGI
jgi:hypothetical protein